MKEKLIKLWEWKEYYIENATCHLNKMIFFSQAFGALEMARALLDDENIEAELVDLWNYEWRARLERKVYKSIK